METRNMREIRDYVAEIRGIMPPKRAEAVIRRLIVLKIEMNPLLERDIDFLIKAVNEPDDEHRNLVCDIIEYTLDRIKREEIITKEEMMDGLKFWGDEILSRLPEDDPLYSAIEYAWKHPETIRPDSEELTTIVNSQVEDEMENMIEEFYAILTRIVEENENR